MTVYDSDTALLGFGRCSIDGVKFFSGLKANSFTWRDADFGTRAGVSADTGFAGAHAEDTEAAKFDTIAVGQSFFESFENGVDGCLGLGAGKTGSFNYLVDNILFNHVCRPFCLGRIWV